MNTKTKTLALMAALALGSAHAASAGTTAGTAITNTASAAFDDPAGGNTGLTVTSNTVTTLVSAVTGFDIVYTAGADDTTASTPATDYDKANVLPGAEVITKYVVNNNSNIDNYVVNIAADTTGSANTATSVLYYADDNNDGVPDVDGNGTRKAAITSVTLSNGGSKNIVQVITVPLNAARGAQYSASPKGTAPAGSVVVGATTLSYTAYNEADNTPNNNGDLQYTRATVYSPAAVVGPVGFPNAGATGTDPNNANITRSGDTQTITVAAGSTTTTFTNTLRNDGALTDSYVLSSTFPTGGSVVFKTPGGATITTTAITENGITYREVNGAVQVQNVPAGGTANFQTVVTYGSAAGAQDFVVSIESVNDTDTTAENTTTNRVNVPGLLFGDAVTANNVTTPTPLNNPNPSVNPGSNATLNMALKNTGGTADTFSFSSQQVQFQVVNQTTGAVTTQNVAVTYTADNDCDGTAGETGETLPLSVAANATGCVVATVAVPTNALKGTTPVFTQTATGTTSTATATDTNDTIAVNLIKDTSLGNNGVRIAKFTAASGVTAGSKPRDSIANPANYTTDATTAAPLANITYKIMAKNVWNTSVAKFYLKDTVPTNTTLQSIALTLNGTAVTSANTIYSTDNGTTWTKLTTAITVVAAGTTYQVAVDTTNDNVNNPDALGPSSTLELDLVVKVN